MSELLDKQMSFPPMVAQLILYAYELGYKLTFGDAYATTGHRKNSTHGQRLAIDLNLFLDGVWLDKGPEAEKGHGLLHDKWDTIGGAKRIANDLNHYSVEFQGRR